MEEEMRQYMEEKEPKVYRLVRLAKAIISIYGLIIAAKKFMERLNRKFEEDSAKGGIKRKLLFLNGENIKVEGTTGDLEVYTALSGVIIDLTKARLKGETTLTVYGIMSGISIKVPPMVRVENDGLELVGGYASLVPAYEDQSLPLLRLKGVTVLSGEEIKIGHKE